jgi:hypothetical protein
MIRGNKKAPTAQSNGSAVHMMPDAPSNLQKMSVYAYGVARNRLHQAAKRLNVPMEVVDDFAQADAIVTLKNYYRRRPKVISDAERRGMPIYVLRANTVSQMENFLVDVYRLEEQNNSDDPFEGAMLEAEQAVMRIRSGEEVVVLTPQSSPVRRQQHEVARENNLFSKSHGKEPKRHVRIYAEDES